MKMIDVNFTPTSVLEWKAEDMVSAVLGEETRDASDAEKKKMLEEATLRLPDDIIPTELTGYAASNETPISPEVPTKTSDFSFYLIKIPVQILIPEENPRLERLRLTFEMLPKEHNGTKIIAYDMFPRTLTEEKVAKLGEVDIDISKALKFVPVLTPVADCLGIKLNFPLEWKTKEVNIQAAGLQSNPIDWYVKDKAIQNGFQGYAIIRVPREASVDISGSLVVEFIKDRSWGREKAQFESDKHVYRLKVD
jgi:hypothetical protein